VAPLQEETWGVILGDGAIFPADTHLDQPQPVAGSSSVATVIKEAAEAPVAGAMAVEIPSSPALSLSALVATSSWSLDKVEPSLTAADFEEAVAVVQVVKTVQPRIVTESQPSSSEQPRRGVHIAACKE